MEGQPCEANAASATPVTRKWRAVRDRETGRYYYYDVDTRETRWAKPPSDDDKDQRRVGFVRSQGSRCIVCCEPIYLTFELPGNPQLTLRCQEYMMDPAVRLRQRAADVCLSDARGCSAVWRDYEEAQQVALIRRKYFIPEQDYPDPEATEGE